MTIRSDWRHKTAAAMKAAALVSGIIAQLNGIAKRTDLFGGNRSPVIPAKAGIHAARTDYRPVREQRVANVAEKRKRRWMILLVILSSSESANLSFLRKQESIR